MSFHQQIRRKKFQLKESDSSQQLSSSNSTERLNNQGARLPSDRIKPTSCRSFIVVKNQIINSMGVSMLSPILLVIIYLYIYCCCYTNALSVPNVDHQTAHSSSLITTSNRAGLLSPLPNVIATSVSSVLNNRSNNKQIDRSSSIYTYNEQDGYNENSGQLNDGHQSLSRPLNSNLEHGNAYFFHNSIDSLAADSKNDNDIIARDELDGPDVGGGGGGEEEIEKVEMFTNNHQQQQPSMTIMTTTTTAMTMPLSGFGYNGHNSRTHYGQLAGAAPTNSFGGNKFLTSPQQHKLNSFTNNIPSNSNSNLNYIHSLLLKPASSSGAIVTSYGLQALQNGYSSPSSSPSALSLLSSSSAPSPLSPSLSSSSSSSSSASSASSSPSISLWPKPHHYLNIQQQLLFANDNNCEQQQNLTSANSIDFSGSSMCGKQQVGSREPRIVGGNKTYEGEFPWAVSIQRHGCHHCGGVIVGKRWILTAAHCVRSQLVSNLLVRTGGHTLSRSLNSINSHLERDYIVDQIIMHNDFSRFDNFSASQIKPTANTNIADIALLKLKSDILWNEFAWPVCFPNRESGDFSGHEAVVIGWGKLNEKSEDFSNDLQKVKLTIIDNRVCQDWFKQAGREMPIDDRIICAGFKTGGKDACHGDSGGPLLSKINGQYVVVGVVSTGIGCARPLLPGLYSRVSSYVNWIERYVN